MSLLLTRESHNPMIEHDKYVCRPALGGTSWLFSCERNHVPPHLAQMYSILHLTWFGPPEKIQTSADSMRKKINPLYSAVLR